MSKVQVLFVCLGNICRSPTAEGVFAQRVKQAGLNDSICVDSAGTGHWFIGHPPDRRACQAALVRGYDLSALRARQVVSDDFTRFDYILAMDNANLADLKALCPATRHPSLKRLLDYDDTEQVEVPDPYYGAQAGFEKVLDLIEQASDGLLQSIVAAHQLCCP